MGLATTLAGDKNVALICSARRPIYLAAAQLRLTLCVGLSGRTHIITFHYIIANLTTTLITPFSLWRVLAGITCKHNPH